MKRIYILTAIICYIAGIAGVAWSDEIRTLNDGTKYLVHPSKILSGGPAPDGIPSIDDPKFVTVDEADDWIDDDELVVLLERDGVERFYPLQILVWHELVNDTTGNTPILISYCPLCGSAIGFVREVDGEAVEFGTSGKLYNSNLVMYDRKTGSYWSQIGGKAIVGEHTGKVLELISLQTVFWGDWKKLRPDAEVLSRDTGFRRSYGRDPYGSYYTEDWLMFPVDNSDSRLFRKAVVFGIEVDGTYKAYHQEALPSGSFADVVGSSEIEVTVSDVGEISFLHINTGKKIPFERDFWFAWVAFHPETEIYPES